jgi:hypothetical protein
LKKEARTVAPGAAVWLRILYALCLLGATFNHAEIILRHGLFYDYGGRGWATSAYWTSLAFIDPLAALLLLIRPRIGLIATAVIMVTDVTHNAWITWNDATRYGIPPLRHNIMFVEQIAFLVFFAVTAPIAWRGLKSAPAEHTEGQR